MSFANTDAAQFWSQVAPTWLEMEEQLELVAGPPGQMAMDRLGLEPGQRVLDLGCGGGSTTIELARRVAPGGEAVGFDIADEMLAGGRERARDLGVANASFVHADVQVHDLGEGRFDAAYSRFGVMFFVDPEAAFTNVHRALRPGGQLSFACWQTVFANEWMLIPGAAAMSVTGTSPPAPAPGEPGPFSLAEPDHVRAILAGAGFDAIDVLAHHDSVVITEDRIPEVATATSRVGAVAELLKDADEKIRTAVHEAIEAALRSRVKDGEVRASRGVLLVTASA